MHTTKTTEPASTAGKEPGDEERIDEHEEAAADQEETEDHNKKCNRQCKEEHKNMSAELA